jgi:hypothetical protein
MGNVDSLAKYNRVLNSAKTGTAKLYSFKKRTDYYLQLLHGDYKAAITNIRTLKKDTSFKYDNLDEQNLADALYHNGKPDSAKLIVNNLLADQAQNNHPEIKLHLFEVLGNIAQDANDNKQAAYNYKMSLQQAKDHIGRLTQVGSISSQIKMDEVQNDYLQKETAYRLWLVFVIIIALLTLIFGIIFYRSVKKRRYYEKLLFTSQKAELAFINSHEVRRHLSNIMGIIDTIKHSENKSKAYLQAQEHLFCSAEKLDEALKDFSKKLDN